MTVQDIAIKYQALDREIKYLTNKIKTFKPKAPPKKEDTNKTETADKKAADESDSSEKGLISIFSAVFSFASLAMAS